MPSLADVLKVQAPGKPTGSAMGPGDTAPDGDEKTANATSESDSGDTEAQLAQFAWEFHQAKNPDDARDALEAFVRLVTE